MTLLAPLVGEQPHTLILGSMPSQISLRHRQYYANPQNAFWWIVSRIYGFPERSVYRQRTAALTAAGVAVWDVLANAVRPGSLDSNIERASEQTNDFERFLAKLPSTELIGFNGGAAKQIFMRHCSHILKQRSYLNCVQLPSTSPAYAAMNKDQKLKIWRSALQQSPQSHSYD